MKEYRYRKHIRWGHYLFAFSGITMSAGILVLIIFIVTVEGELFPEAVFFALSMLGISAIQVMFSYLFYRMAGITVSIDEDSIVYMTRSGPSRIPLDTITRLDFPSIKYTGGWIKIVTPDKTIRLTACGKSRRDYTSPYFSGL